MIKNILSFDREYYPRTCLNNVLMGFLGMYCFDDDCPLNGIMASSTLTSLCKWYVFVNCAHTSLIVGLIFSYPGLVVGCSVELSTKCKYLCNSKKRFLEMRLAIGL